MFLEQREERGFWRKMRHSWLGCTLWASSRPTLTCLRRRRPVLLAVIVGCMTLLFLTRMMPLHAHEFEWTFSKGSSAGRNLLADGKPTVSPNQNSITTRHLHTPTAAKTQRPVFMNDKNVKEILTHEQLMYRLEHLKRVPLPTESPQRVEPSANDSDPTTALAPLDMDSDYDSLADADERPPVQVYLVMYYAAWCPYCHRMAPIWSHLASIFRCTPGIEFLSFECSGSDDPSRLKADRKAPAAVCKDEGVESFPTFVAYSRSLNSSQSDSKPTSETTDNHIVKRVIKLTRSVTSYRNWILENTLVKTLISCTSGAAQVNGGAVSTTFEESDIEPHDRWLLEEEFGGFGASIRLHDGLEGLKYLLRNWVVVNPEERLQGLRLNRVLDLLNTVANLIPVSETHEPLMLLADGVYTQSQNFAPPLIRGDEYQDVLNVTRGLNIKPLGVMPNLLGPEELTGSIWLMLHTLTVSLDQQYAAAEDAKKVDPATKIPELLDPVALLGIIYDTIDSFFGCSACRVHFLHTLDTCSDDLGNWLTGNVSPVESQASDKDAVSSVTSSEKSWRASKALVMGLWRLHNAVTLRTAVEATADAILSWEESTGKRFDRKGKSEDHPLLLYEGKDVRFPSSKLCPACRKKIPAGEEASVIVNSSWVDAMTDWERLNRGIAEGDVESDIVKRATIPDDNIYDVITGFDLEETFKFLVSYFWKKPEWSPIIEGGVVKYPKLHWNATSETYQLARQQPPTLKSTGVLLRRIKNLGVH